MKAGRELDALIAEKVMGLTRHDESYVTESIGKVLRFVWRDGCGDCVYSGDMFLPHYSTNIADAWEVVPVLDQRLDQFWSVVRAGEKFEFYSNPYELGDYTAYVEAGTLPLLLCLAALKAKGVTGEQHG